MSRVVPSVLYTVESPACREGSRSDLEGSAAAPEASFARLIRENPVPARSKPVEPDADPGVRPEAD